MEETASSLPELLAVDQRTVDPVAQRCGEGRKAEHQAAIRGVPALLQQQNRLRLHSFTKGRSSEASFRNEKLLCLLIVREPERTL